GAGDFIRGLAASHRSPLAAIRAYAECMAHLAQSPAALARNLAYLQIDLADPDFRAHLEVQARATRAGLTDLLGSAIAAGGLRKGTDVGRRARTVEVVISGSLLAWAFYHEGTPESWIRADVDSVLEPHLAVKSMNHRKQHEPQRTQRTQRNSKH